MSYLPPESNEIYTISVTDYLPTFVLYSVNNKRVALPSLNDASLNNWTWKQYSGGSQKIVTVLDTISCKDLINSWTQFSEVERAAYLRELPSKFSLCPNITEFKVRGGTMGDTWLELSIVPTEEGEKFSGWTSIY